MKRYCATFNELENLIRSALFVGATEAPKKLDPESYVAFANRMIPEFMRISQTFRGLREVPEGATHFAAMKMESTSVGMRPWYYNHQEIASDVNENSVASRGCEKCGHDEFREVQRGPADPDPGYACKKCGHIFWI